MKYRDLLEAPSALRVQLMKMHKSELVYLIEAWHTICSQGEWDEFHDQVLLTTRLKSGTYEVDMLPRGKMADAIIEFDMLGANEMMKSDEAAIKQLLKLVKSDHQEEGGATNAGAVIIFLDMFEAMGKDLPEFATIRKSAERMSH